MGVRWGLQVEDGQQLAVAQKGSLACQLSCRPRIPRQGAIYRIPNSCRGRHCRLPIVCFLCTQGGAKHPFSLLLHVYSQHSVRCGSPTVVTTLQGAEVCCGSADENPGAGCWHQCFSARDAVQGVRRADREAMKSPPTGEPAADAPSPMGESLAAWIALTGLNTTAMESMDLTSPARHAPPLSALTVHQFHAAQPRGWLWAQRMLRGKPRPRGM